jgi:hypothetical protein
MFRCQLCQQLSRPGETSQRVVLEIRRRQYPQRIDADVKRVVTASGVSRKQTVDDPGGIGWEATRTAAACQRCQSLMSHSLVDDALKATCRKENAVYQLVAREELSRLRERHKGSRHRAET